MFSFRNAESDRQLLLDMCRPKMNIVDNIIKMDIDSPSKTTLNPDSYHTPFCAQKVPLQQDLIGNTRLFVTRKKKYKKTFTFPNHLHQTSHREKGQSVQKSQKAGLMSLAEWLRWAAVSLGVGKHVFDNALGILTESSQKMETTYALAAASLVIATKFQHGVMISRHRELPIRPANRLPRVLISQAAKVEGLLLNTLNFSIPIPSSKINLLLTLTQTWNLFLRRNSRKNKSLPLHVFETGLDNQWQKRNLACASYLLDLLSIGASGHFSSQEIYLTASLITVGAVNCFQPEMITNPGYILLKLAKCFLQRYYKITKQQEHEFMQILQGIRQEKLYEKLSLVPSNKEDRAEKSLKTEGEKLEWLNKLEFIPFSAGEIFKK